MAAVLGEGRAPVSARLTENVVSVWENQRSEAAPSVNSKRPLTHLLDYSERQAAMSMASERWLPIPGYEGRYDVSDQGRVRSWLYWFAQPHAHLPRILRQTANPVDSHTMVGLFADGRCVTFYVHRLVMLSFAGPLPAGMETRHLDGDPTNNCLSNLAYGTHAENKLDRARHGTDHQLNKTHCKRGHEFTPDNTKWIRDGRARQCRACARIMANRRYHAKHPSSAWLVSDFREAS